MLAIEGAMNGGSDLGLSVPAGGGREGARAPRGQGSLPAQEQSPRAEPCRGRGQALLGPSWQAVRLRRQSWRPRGIHRAKVQLRGGRPAKGKPELGGSVRPQDEAYIPPVGTYVVVPRKFIVNSKLKGTCTLFQNAVENVTVPFNAHAAAMTSGEDERGARGLLPRQPNGQRYERWGRDLRQRRVLRKARPVHQVDRHVSMLPGVGRCPVHETAVRRALRSTGRAARRKVPVHQRLLRLLLRLQVPRREDAHREMRQHDLAGVTPDERKLVTAWDSAYDAWARHEKLEKLSKRRAYQQKRLKYSKRDGEGPSPGSQAVGEGRCEDAQGE